MDVYIDNRQNILPISLQSVKPLVESVLAFEGCHCDEVGIHFIEIEEICALHDQYFDDPSPTDCISFPMDGRDEAPTGSQMLGDVFVCPAVAIEYAAKHRKDPYVELSLYTVHGLLHLMGYNDIEEGDRSAMRAAEARHMRRLQRSQLILRNR